MVKNDCGNCEQLVDNLLLLAGYLLIYWLLQGGDDMGKSQSEEMVQDTEFLNQILFEIRDYAISAGQVPDETLKAVAEWILALLEVATFNGRG